MDEVVVVLNLAIPIGDSELCQFSDWWKSKPECVKHIA